MNAVTPVYAYDRVANLYVLTTAGLIATINKPSSMVMRIILDYFTQVTPPVTDITLAEYAVNVGSNPPLAVTSTNIYSNYLDFLVSGGVPGTSYILTVSITTPSSSRSDTISFLVPSDGCNCDGAATPPSLGNTATIPTGTYINGAPKYIVLNSPPIGCNVMDQWFDPLTNNLYEYITDGTNYWWQQLVQSAPPLPVTFATTRLVGVVPDGKTTQFTLTTPSGGIGTLVDILFSTDVMVSVDGVWQEPDTQFIAWTNQIQFATAPTSDSYIFIIWFEH